eukprot:TRINITY_DN5248_c0_g1_i1.p1 TRINITY_DN5248_c0_g1~~TRINITY_DN5248_c0_g1_i1.p1  ORF type:complete len:291 (-),score=61.96 TRINITY_DN5248_c0_g1_i1:190-1062(-)
MSHEHQSLATKKWRKILWERQDYPDNYVDATFLNQLVQNANFTEYSLKEAIRGSTVVTQQISIVALFVGLFLTSEKISITILLPIQFSSLLIGILLAFFIDPTYYTSNLFGSIKTLVLLFASLFCLSPVLRTLTEPFSEDTVIACTSLLLSGHLFFHDYNFVNGDSDKFSAPVSLNAAIFASVLMSSRLPSPIHVFALVSLAIELFAMFPFLRRSIRLFSLFAHLLLTFVLFTSASLLLWTFSSLIATLFVALSFFIGFVCPLLLVIIQRYKNEIRGPWDEAVAQISSIG